MGASDGFLFPLYQAYIGNHLKGRLRNVKKIGWLGLQNDYPVSLEIKKINPNTEHHFFDIVPQGDSKFSHKLDLNDSGYGDNLRNENFDLLTVLRCSCYIRDHDACIAEFKNFIGDSKEKFIIFEDLDPNPKVGAEIAHYHGVRTEKTKRAFTQQVLSSHFSIADVQRWTAPDGRWYEISILSLKD